MKTKTKHTQSPDTGGVRGGGDGDGAYVCVCVRGFFFFWRGGHERGANKKNTKGEEGISRVTHRKVARHKAVHIVNVCNGVKRKIDR